MDSLWIAVVSSPSATADRLVAQEEPGMAEPHEELQIAFDPHLQKLVWKLQPIGWAVMIAFVVAGMLGLFGGIGPFNATSQSAAGIAIHYERFPAYRGTSDLRIELQPNSLAAFPLRLRVDAEYLERMRPQTILPAPVRTIAEKDHVIYEFAFGDGAATILLNVRAERSGIAHARLALGAEEISLRQYVYP